MHAIQSVNWEPGAMKHAIGHIGQLTKDKPGAHITLYLVTYNAHE